MIVSDLEMRACWDLNQSANFGILLCTGIDINWAIWQDSNSISKILYACCQLSGALDKGGVWLLLILNKAAGKFTGSPRAVTEE